MTPVHRRLLKGLRVVHEAGKRELRAIAAAELQPR